MWSKRIKKMSKWNSHTCKSCHGFQRICFSRTKYVFFWVYFGKNTLSTPAIKASHQQKLFKSKLYKSLGIIYFFFKKLDHSLLYGSESLIWISRNIKHLNRGLLAITSQVCIINLGLQIYEITIKSSEYWLITYF